MDMRNMPPLTDAPLARRSDPATSHAAAKKVKADGIESTQQAMAFAWVRKAPGHTASEYAQMCQAAGGDMDRYDFGRRLPALAKTKDRHGDSVQPLVRKVLDAEGNVAKRVCTVTGFEACTWEPVEVRA